MSQTLYSAAASMPERLRDAYLWACLMELEAIKPGNVSRHSAGHSMRARDFKESAHASVEPLVLKRLSLGERIYGAVEATHNAVGCNTNLGIVLLCAPLMHAFLGARVGQSLRESLHEVLCASNVNDAVWTFRAIRLASPGGLGRSDSQDISTQPTVSLTEAMCLAADKDRIGFQYASDFVDVFDFALPRLRALRAQAGIDASAVTKLFLGLLARFPDSHIGRKFGIEMAREISARALALESEYLRAGESRQIHQRLRQVDAEFKTRGINPGTTADLTVATLLSYRMEELLNSDEKELSLMQRRKRNARIPYPSFS